MRYPNKNIGFRTCFCRFIPAHLKNQRTIRLNKAAEMLRQKTDTVTQIAYETGFNNLSWFAKAFKEQFGVSPSKYTKSG